MAALASAGERASDEDTLRRSGPVVSGRREEMPSGREAVAAAALLFAGLGGAGIFGSELGSAVRGLEDGGTAGLDL